MLEHIRKKTSHPKLLKWIEDMASLCSPDQIFLVKGSEEEHHFFCQKLVQEEIFIPLQRKGSYWCHTDPDDVARVEENTFICSYSKEDAGPTNNWKDPQEMKKVLTSLFKGCMKGRTMYVVPYLMGPPNSAFSIVGVEITDSLYVVVNLYLMARIGDLVLKSLEEKAFIPGMHSVGYPLEKGQKDSSWPCNPKHRYIVHFPEERSIWSFGSGYGGNALLCKKCLALRIASVLGKEEGWLAEHMLILGLTNPQGKKKYLAAAFPSACGKTNLALLQSTLPGWKVSCVGDDIAWMRWGKEGRLYAVNPEKGFFGVAPGTSEKTNPLAMQIIKENTIFTNVALTQNRDVWWEGMSATIPDNLTTWLNTPYKAGEKAAHPNSRFTAPIEQCPILDEQYNSKEGVPLSAIIFGGRRASLYPLVREALHWSQGVFFGASLTSETTAAAKGKVGVVRHDPFAMLPFCGYHMGDYFSHWLAMGEGKDKKLPKIFQVNWFRKDPLTKEFLWPGYRDNIHVLKWIFESCEDTYEKVETPLGIFPSSHAIDFKSLYLPDDIYLKLFDIDKKAWQKEAQDLEKYFEQFKPKWPSKLQQELENLKKSL